jgi:osmotically-inducible protein OsmY
MVIAGGELILNGIVPSRKERKRAEAIAVVAPGVSGVANRLRIGEWS